MARKCSKVVRSDTYYWKWIIIALHNAMQTFMVLALKGSNGLAVLRKKSAEEWLIAYESGLDTPETKLDSFLSLFKKIKNKYILQYGMSKKFKCNSKINNSVKRINNEFRNFFVHYQPGLWSIELVGLPEILLNCTTIIQFCGWESGNVFWSDKKLERKAKDELRKLRKNLSILKKTYASS